MTTTALPVGAALDPTRPEHGTWERAGTFDFEIWPEGWAVCHTSSDTILAFCGSPGECRSYVASGEAQADLDRMLAHRRGEHAGQRQQMCGRCA
jgi:hypothetical protein